MKVSSIAAVAPFFAELSRYAMDKSAVVQHEPDADPSAHQTVATGAFVVDAGLASNPISTLLLRLPFSIPGAGDFIVESAIVAGNGNASLAVRRTTEPVQTLFLAAWVWQRGPDPYFGVRLPAGGTIHVYLQTANTDRAG